MSISQNTVSEFKADDVSTYTDWKGGVHTSYTKTIGNASISAGSLERLEKMCNAHVAQKARNTVTDSQMLEGMKQFGTSS